MPDHVERMTPPSWNPGDTPEAMEATADAMERSWKANDAPGHIPHLTPSDSAMAVVWLLRRLASVERRLASLEPKS